MALKVVHRTEYVYDAEVTTSYGRLHLLPRSGGVQRLVSSHLEVSPAAAELGEHVDFFGNRSTYFCVREPHTRLVVTATSLVEVDRRAPYDLLVTTLPWEHARDAARISAEVDVAQFRLPSPMIGLIPELAEYAAPSFSPGRPIVDALADLVARIHRDFAYTSGATDVTTLLPEVLASRQGVCQDFAHLAVGCLRAVGLSARYVSGYIETLPPPGRPRLQGADASHAWASVYVPPVGWIDLDPTNDQFVDDRYVTTAWGRDYADVPPLKGVIFTEARKNTLSVMVDVVSVDTPVAQPGGPGVYGGARG
jgi:transglutaminase-like putative cysteine protease